MKKRTDSSRNVQILLALDSTSDNRAAMRAAVALAARLRAQLLGLFLEDTNLLRLADLPFTREIMRWSAQERPLTEQDLLLSLRALASRTEMELGRVAAKANVRWSFRVERGPRLKLLMEASGTSDVLLVAEHRRSIKGEGSVLRSARRQPMVYLVYTGSLASQRALTTATAMIEHQVGGLTVFVLAYKRKELKRLHLEATTRLESQGITPWVVDCLEEAGVLNFMSKLTRLSGVALILPGDVEVPNDPLLFQRLLDQVGCPVVVVR
jgi:hypothetical protein